MLAAAAAIAARPALAQERFPSRPIQIVVPYPPGGSNDLVARAVGRKLAEIAGQPVVVENRPGAGGSIGTDLVAKSRPDGCTLAFVSSSFATNAAIQTKLPFDPVRSLAPVALMGRVPFVIAVSNALPVRSLGELVALARERPGRLNYASSGAGSINQFATEMLAAATGVRLSHVPYKGMGPATVDLIGGHVDVLIASVPSILAHVRAGKVRALAVTSATRSPLAPDVPTAAQSGVPGYAFEAWFGVLAAAGTPPDVIGALNAAFNRILALPDVLEFLRGEGIEPTPATPAEFGALIPKEIARWQQLAVQTGIRAE